MAIFVIGILNFVYADVGPTIGENQAKSIAKNYLISHNLPYKVTTAKELVQVKNTQTGSTKWVTPTEYMDIASNDTSPWNSPATGEITAVWKVYTVDNQGKGTGSIWVNSETGKITKTELKAVTTQNNTANQTANVTANATNQTAPGTSNNNAWIIIGIVIIIIAAGTGYWMYRRR